MSGETKFPPFHTLDFVLKKVQVTLAEFHGLRLTPVDELSVEERKVIKQIRDAVPAPTSDTWMQKVIPIEYIERYLRGEWWAVGGCLTKAADVRGVTMPKDVFNSLRLDYKDTPYTKKTDYGLIKFKTDQTDQIYIPYHKKFGDPVNVKHEISYPQTGNGFTASENGTVIPEYETPWGVFLDPEDGAELYRVANGEELLIGIFDERKERFVPMQSTKRVRRIFNG
ncbi:hypothetical protein [Bacillus sp. 165]|uniref:hypothetical protein n=1 Tax=Bacillus sp. 165 TaxID=1529117 RepID=UPI001ADD4581|nr:hypothetical protein [Bacillus sp. 165]MBO9129007.1 hypothetical protein [Bacillus sp. 165]